MRLRHMAFDIGSLEYSIQFQSAQEEFRRRIRGAGMGSGLEVVLARDRDHGALSVTAFAISLAALAYVQRVATFRRRPATSR